MAERRMAIGAEDAVNRAWFRPGCAITVLGAMIALVGLGAAAFGGDIGPLLLGAILAAAGFFVELFAIFMEYGPLKFDPPEGQTKLERSIEAEIVQRRFRPGVVFVIAGILLVAAGVICFLIPGAEPWRAPLTVLGLVLAALGGELQLTVAIRRAELGYGPHESGEPVSTRAKRAG